MKTDLYTKTMLTVIAICLTILVLRETDFMPSAFATQSSSSDKIQGSSYAWIPVNEDGSINVKIISDGEPMDVNIEEIGGRWIRGGSTWLPVKVKD